MKFEEFSSAIRRNAPPGTILENPGGGTSEISGYPDGKISYLRGKSTITVSLRRFFEAYEKFLGKTVSSSDLRNFAPEVFDSAARPAGHSCNCTVLLLLLNRIGVASGISGKGKRGKPFSTTIFDRGAA